MTATLRSTFTTTVRVIDWIHRRPTHMRSAAQPTSTARFAKSHVHVITVADLANGCPAYTWYAANFPTGQ